MKPINYHSYCPLILFTVLLHTENVLSAPTLIIPQGSYLESYNIGSIYLDDGDFYFKAGRGALATKLSFQSTNSVPNAEQCWKMGFDLIKGEETDLACDSSSPSSVERASNFLYSALVPFGSYLSSCTGILQSQEENQTILYASCLERQGGRRSVANSFYKPNRLDITNCQGEIINTNGVLECTGSTVTPKQVLTGSYLESCSLSYASYNFETDNLYAFCGYGSDTGDTPYSAFYGYNLENASNCIGSGKDIVWVGNKLECRDDSEKEVTRHTASLKLPLGNYLTTCSRVAFYPCMGSSGLGVLAAQCANKKNDFIETRLEDRDVKCRMAEMGFVSNINGVLKCDPDITAFDEQPTSADLMYFECPTDN